MVDSLNVPAGVNNFVLRFANVNGSGSASANGLVSKSLFRMGLDVGPKNMFPSNIQGFPTWYEIRVSTEGYTGRRGGVDIMVAMNPQTYDQDLRDVASGGYYIFDEARYNPIGKNRDDVCMLPLPLTALSLEFDSAKARPMLKNVIYVGALMALINLEEMIVKELLSELYGRKPKLWEANLRALNLGYEYAKTHFECPLSLHVTKRTSSPKDGDASHHSRILVDGNQALALGSLYGGATICSWYPITPSTSVVDHFEKHCNRLRMDASNRKNFAIVQAEDEIAAIGMVLGAAWNGARAFTATSGPGLSLMTEFLGFSYYAEIPAVIFNIQRVGPSTGMPTRTQQADLLAAAFASHGDTKHVLLFPGSPAECFSMAAQSFDLADMLQTTVIVMSDIELGMNEYVSESFKWDDESRYNKGKVVTAEQLANRDKPWFRYQDVDGDGICYRTLPGTHPTLGANLTRGSGHDRFGRYTEDGGLYQENLDRIKAKFETARSMVPHSIITQRKSSGTSPDPKLGCIYLGILREAVTESLDLLALKGHAINDMRVRGFPFHQDVTDFIHAHEKILVLDQNRDGQLRSLLILETETDPKRLLSIRSYDGLPLTAQTLSQMILNCLKAIL